MVQKFVPFFGIPVLLSVIALGAVYVGLGSMAFLTALLLAVLEITLSFDNAVVNAKVLERMPQIWHNRFLTWGLVIAVFGTRALLPVLIVAASAWVSPLTVSILAFHDPAAYAQLLSGAQHAIYAFGGIFLLLVGLKFFLDEEKDTHWIQGIEYYFAQWGKVAAIELLIALIVLTVIAFFDSPERTAVLFAGLMGVGLFIAMQGLVSFFEVETDVSNVGFALFLYLNVLDAAFSLDSVVGAFALSTQIPVIVVGLGIGAYFVRSLTLYMVHHKTLKSLVYIENGAHWAILGLAVVMFASLFFAVPEPATGFIGLVFIGLAYVSSIRMTRAS